MKYIAYMAAAIFGLFLRTMAAYSIGWTTYRINGKDIVVAVLCMVVVWSAKRLFMPAPKNSRSRNRSNKNDR